MAYYQELLTKKPEEIVSELKWQIVYYADVYNSDGIYFRFYFKTISIMDKFKERINHRCWEKYKVLTYTYKKLLIFEVSMNDVESWFDKIKMWITSFPYSIVSKKTPIYNFVDVDSLAEQINTFWLWQISYIVPINY